MWRLGCIPKQCYKKLACCIPCFLVLAASKIDVFLLPRFICVLLVSLLFDKSVDRMVPSGWCSTVGITGWTVGGGYGPFSPSMGLGIDNSLEFELLQIHPDPDRPGRKIVKKVVASATSNPDLLWALKGGGGSTWGVITSITTRLVFLLVELFLRHGNLCQRIEVNLMTVVGCMYVLNLGHTGSQTVASPRTT